MHSRKQIEDFCDSMEIDVLLLPEEYDIAIVGLSCKFNEYSVVYDTVKCYQVLVDFHGMTYEDAVEYFDFNIAGGYLGAGTCTFLVEIPEE